MDLTRGLFIKCVLGVLLLAPFVIFYGCGALPPMVSSLTADPAAVPVEGTTMISCEASSSTAASLTYTWSASGGTLSSSSGKHVSWTAPATTGTYTITVIVSDGSQSVTNTVQIFVTSRTSPIVTTITATPTTVIAGNASIISCEATSPYSTSLTYTWVASRGTLSSSSGKFVSWTAPATAGTNPYSITVVVGDGYTTTSNTVMITVNDADGPNINKLTATPTTVAVNKTSTLTCEASDSDGFAIAYSWSATSGTLLSSLGPTVVWQAPSTTGTCTMTATVTNSRNAVASGTVKVIVVNYGSVTVNNLTLSSPTVSGGGIINLVCDATESNGLDLTYRWTCNAGAYSSTSGNTATWTAPTGGGVADYTLGVTVTNSSSSSSESKSVHVTS